MKFEIKECVVEGDKIRLLVKYENTFDELAREAERENYRYQAIKTEAIKVISEQLAKEFMAMHKMEIVNSLSIGEVVNAIQLKMVENFSLKRHE